MRRCGMVTLQGSEVARSAQPVGHRHPLLLQKVASLLHLGQVQLQLRQASVVGGTLNHLLVQGIALLVQPRDRALDPVGFLLQASALRRGDFRRRSVRR